MKSKQFPLKTSIPRSRNGFALVVTLSLMILMTVVAVGLLTLSTVSLRASAQGEAMATARANARLALMLAIGELQKTAGPDQRVTARAEILDEYIANPKLTGVWKSWEIKAAPTPSQPAEFEKAARDAKFAGWLASGPDPAAIGLINFASQVSASPVTLWGKGSLGATAADSSLVSASKVPLASSPGAFAWAVMDEGVKARINTRYSDDADRVSTKTMQLGAGERPGVEYLTGLNKLERKFFEKNAPQSATIDKGISRLNFALAGDNLVAGVRESFKPLTHDVTTQSVGLFTDVARGGLKQDFHLMTNSSSLPSEYLAKGVYVSRLGMTTANAPSDPRWESLQQFARLYRDKVTSSGGLPMLKTQVPNGWVAADSATLPLAVNKRPPAGLVLMPTMAKVQVLFSLIGRDLYDYPPPAGNFIPADAPGFHGPQEGHFRGTRFQYDLHVMYTPIVTLHNPYNVALEFSTMRVEFVHTPFAMTIYRDGVAQSTGLVPVETMYADNEGGNLDKTFGIDLKTKTSAGIPGATTFKLLPGEVKLFSPYIEPTRTYRDEFRTSRETWDIYVGTGITAKITAIPGWRGDGIGYGCDWVTGGKRVNGNKEEGHWAACLGLDRNDNIHVEFAPLSVPQYSGNKFIVRMTATTPASSTPIVANAIEIDYESETGLQDFIIGKGKTLRYPKTGTVKGIDLVDHSTTPVSQIKNVKPFALLSVQGKATSGGRDASNKDGRLATKPWAFAHAVVGGSSQKVVSEHSANFSHEIDLQVLDKGTSNLLQVDKQDRSNFMSGHSADNGTKFGVMYDVPLAPVQSFPTLNGANPGGSSGYLPRFAQPIGNSWAHPLISSTKMIESKSGGNLLDHSFLLNLALYDGFYFSGLADQSGPFGTAKTTNALAGAFASGSPLADPRMIFYQPNGQAASVFSADIGKPTAYKSTAAWQLMEGAFNVNSTSVEAWKAMLSSIHDSQAVYNKLLKTAATPTTAITPLPAVATGKVRMSRLRLPVAAAGSSSAELQDAYWLGPREYSDAQLQTLAENIVKQVRLRGPFLSMADFVNRRLGASTNDMAQRGALQQAIDDSKLNQANAVAANAGFEIPAAKVANYKYLNAAAGAGSSYQGAPGFLTQADILSVLGNAATPRSDTFTIRGYGEARDDKGKILARATCEAVVQRFPEWLDPADKVETTIATLTSQSNKTFGRRFLVTSMRWLSFKEI